MGSVPEVATRGSARPDRPLGPAGRSSALQAVLGRYPAPIVIALDDAAVRVPTPDDPLFAGSLPLPGTDATVVDFAVPADRMEVVRIWESAKAVGLGTGILRVAGRPERRFVLTVVDARHRFGVWVGVLVPDDGPPGSAAPPTDPALLIPTRPRTAVLHKNLYAIITDVDERTTAMLGWSRAEMVGRRSLEFVHPDDHERAIGQWLEMRARRAGQRVRLRYACRDGSWMWVEIENVFVGLDDPDGLVAIAHLTDISDEMAAHEAVRQREALFTRLAEALPVGVVQLDPDGRIVYANARLTHLLGAHGAGTVDELIAAVAPADRAGVRQAVRDAAGRGVDHDLEVRIPPPDGARNGRRGAGPDAEGRRYLFTVRALSGQEGAPGAILSVTDVTDSARLREELRIKATYDPLTTCLNRATILTELERALSRTGAGSVAVLFVDLDGFKSVNDTYGHATGDELLALTARRLTAQARATDLVGRLGGDEFLLICPGVTDPGLALALAQRVHDHVNGRVRVAGRRLQLAASVGVTLAPAGAAPDDLVAQADTAMYRAKRAGTGPVLFSGPAAGR